MTKFGTHPYTWWTAALVFSIGAAVANQIWVLLTLIGLCIAAVWVWHADQDSARVFRGFCYFALLALIVRLFFAVLFGNPFARDVLFTLPVLQLPNWFGGLSLGGEVTVTALKNAATEGLRMGAIIIAVGAASALTPPVRLLAKLPSALYEVGLSILIALTALPALANDVSRTQTALRLRGRSHTGLRAVTTSLAPTLDFAMRRSTVLAASMESRGYGKHKEGVSNLQRQTTSASLILVLIFALLGVAALMSVSFQKAFGSFALIGLIVATFFLGVSTRGLSKRTFYRAISWEQQDSLVVLTTITLIVGLVIAQ